jgi:hypothetical protein
MHGDVHLQPIGQAPDVVAERQANISARDNGLLALVSFCYANCHRAFLLKKGGWGGGKQRQEPPPVPRPGASAGEWCPSAPGPHPPVKP